jgi:hypothetical protein
LREAEDLKPRFGAWAQQERPPREVLRAFANPFQAIQRKRDPAEQQALRQKCFADLLGVLDYPSTPDTVELEGGILRSLSEASPEFQISRSNMACLGP